MAIGHRRKEERHTESVIISLRPAHVAMGRILRGIQAGWLENKRLAIHLVLGQATRICDSDNNCCSVRMGGRQLQDHQINYEKDRESEFKTHESSAWRNSAHTCACSEMQVVFVFLTNSFVETHQTALSHSHKFIADLIATFTCPWREIYILHLRRNDKASLSKILSHLKQFHIVCFVLRCLHRFQR